MSGKKEQIAYLTLDVSGADFESFAQHCAPLEIPHTFSSSSIQRISILRYSALNSRCMVEQRIGLSSQV